MEGQIVTKWRFHSPQPACKTLEKSSLAAVCPFRQTGAGHALAQAALLHKSLFQVCQLAVEEVAGELDQPHHDVGRDGRVGIFDSLAKRLVIGLGPPIQLAETPGVAMNFW